MKLAVAVIVSTKKERCKLDFTVKIFLNSLTAHFGNKFYRKISFRVNFKDF